MSQLSAFADEISKDFDEQLAVLVETRVTHIELRGVWGKNVLKLTRREIRDIRAAADAEGIKFSAIGSPLGKFPLHGDFNEQLEGVRRALEYAQILEAPFIRLFSYHIPKGEDAADHRVGTLTWRQTPSHPTPPPHRQGGGPQQPLPIRLAQGHQLADAHG